VDVCRENDDRNAVQVGLLSKDAQELPTVHPRHPQVEEQDARAVHSQMFERLDAVTGLMGVMPKFGQVPRDRIASIWMVFRN
jgi:hypothetical protein